MSLAISHTAYQDCYEIFDIALSAKKGAQRLFDTKEGAWAFRSRLNHARELDRRLNRKIHSADPDHPLYGKSVADVLTFRVVEDQERGLWLCQLVRVELPKGEVEVLEGED